MSNFKKLAKGFTLIELMIVVAIIGILAAIAIPNFVKFQCRSKQSEAKGNLKALYVAQESYRAEFDKYVTDCGAGCNIGNTNDIGFAPKGSKIRYTYNDATANNATQFTATANPAAGFTAELASDQWTITEANAVSNLINGCK